MRPQSSFGWAICRPATWSHDAGTAMLFTVATTRAGAISKFLTLCGPQIAWKGLYRKGWRARRVEVTPILFGAAA